MGLQTLDDDFAEHGTTAEPRAAIVHEGLTSNYRLLLGIVKANRDSFERARALYRDQLAPEFNPFQFIEPDELKLSRIIGWLLDPNASHGQGWLFLKAFTAALGLEWTQAMCASATVRLEAPTRRLTRHNRRIDILIVSGTEALAIENKPWAGDQAAQVSDYLSHLGSEYHASTLLYLCGYAQNAGGQSISPEEHEAAVSNKRLIEWNFSTFADWLDTVLSQCKADRVRSFIQAFIAYLRAEFEGAEDVSEHTHMVDQITRDSTLLGSALDLLQAGDSLYDALCEQLQSQIEAAAKDRGWQAACNLNRSPYAGIRLMFPEVPDYSFSLEFQSSPFNRMIFGVQGQPEGLESRPQIQQRLTASHGKGSSSAHWAWFRQVREDEPQLPLPANWTIAKSPWLGIATGETASLILKCAEDFRQTLTGAFE